jgi:hypothetical protein
MQALISARLTRIAKNDIREFSIRVSAGTKVTFPEYF